MGFDPNFIQGHHIPFPVLSPRVRASAFNSGIPIDHTRFSIIFNEKRGLAIVTGHNIDGSNVLASSLIRRRNRFRFDTSVPNNIQVANKRGYLKNPYDRGHLVRRVALHWGDLDTAIQADSESFFWTNIVPQHENLHDTAWGNIEDWVLDLAESQINKASVFTGPILTMDDLELINQPGELPVQIPAGFWKVIALKHRGQLSAAAFVVWQRDFDRLEPVEFDPVLEQVRISTIEVLTGLTFNDLRGADTLRFGQTESGEFSPDGAEVKPTPIKRKEDIFL